MRKLLFTDLDGTLLDHETYEVEPALPAVRRLLELKIPIILCSSKTAAEMIPLRRRLGIPDPFIVENGGGIYFPAGFGVRVPEARTRGDFQRLALGPPIEVLVEFLKRFSDRRQIAVRTFLDYSPEELASEVGLTREAAERALEREFDLPYHPLPPELQAQLEERARRHGLRVARGGRFFHLTGQFDKGSAVHRLAAVFGQFWGEQPVTIALGDSLNDLEMLRAVDDPIIIPNPESTAALSEAIPGASTAHQAGPAGWNSAVLSLVGS